MLRQMTRRGKIEVALRDDELLQPLGKILEPESVSIDTPPMRMPGKEEGEYFKHGSVTLPREDYDELLRYLHDAGDVYHSAYDLTGANPRTQFLLPQVRTHTQVHIDDRTYSARQSHEGNSAIQFVRPGTDQRDTGFIECIWSAPLKSRVRTFFVVRPHRRLPPLEEQLAPFQSFNVKYATRIVDYAPSERPLIIEQQHVVSHLSTFRRPAGTYGIPRETLIVSWSLNRGKR